MIFLALLLLGTVFQGVAMFRSGLLYNFGIGYWGPLARDGVWHEALVGQLKLSIPPQNPGFAGHELINYHYLYDLLVAGLSLITKIPADSFIYQLLPVVLSLLLGIGSFILASKLFKNKFVSVLAVFFTYFASSFGWVIDILKSRQIGGESAFWANQPVSMNLNPPYAISLILLIFGIILLDNYIHRPNFAKGIGLIMIFGTLIGFKAYAGIVGIVAITMLTFKQIIFDKKYILLPVTLGSVLVFSLYYWLVSRNGSAFIEFQPLWLINTMIDAGDRVGIPVLTAKRFAYLGGHKYLRLIAVESLGLIIFFVGNLGTRIAGFWAFKKKYFKNDLHLFIIFAALASLAPPLLFVQKGNPWNIVQFYYYFMFFMGLYAANALIKFPKYLIIITILITPISSIATFRSWLYPNPPAYLPAGEYQALTFLSKEPSGTVLKHPFDNSLREKYNDPYPLVAYADNAYVSAHSAHPVFVEDVEQQIILDTDYKSRLADADRFFVEKDLNWSKEFLKGENIKYLYLPKVYQLPMAEQEYPIKKIYENNEVNIYLVQ